VVDFAGTAGADALSGTAAAEVFVAGAGNDTIGGGAGNDVIEVTDTAFFAVDGGSGNDKLSLVGSCITLDLTAIADGRISGIEQIDISGGGRQHADPCAGRLAPSVG